MEQKLKRTNSKDYTDRMDAFLLEAIESDQKTNKGKINGFFNAFKICTNHVNSLARHPNRQDRLSNYLQGLPSDINLPFYYYDILKLAKSLHEVDSLTEKQESRIIENYWNHMAFHLIRLEEKLNK